MQKRIGSLPGCGREMNDDGGEDQTRRAPRCPLVTATVDPEPRERPTRRCVWGAAALRLVGGRLLVVRGAFAGAARDLAEAASKGSRECGWDHWTLGFE